MSAVKLIAIFSENKVGQLAKVTEVLAEAGVNIRWITVATTETFGVIKFLVDKCELAYQRLKQAGFPVSLTEVLAIEVPDKPGGLYPVARCLAEHGINMENSSGFVTRNRAVLLMEVKDLGHARQALESQRFILLSEEETLIL